MMYFQLLQLPFVTLGKAWDHQGTRAQGKGVNCHQSDGSWARTALCSWRITPLLRKQRALSSQERHKNDTVVD